MLEGQGILGEVKILKGVQEYNRLLLALTEIYQDNLNQLSFEISRSTV